MSAPILIRRAKERDAREVLGLLAQVLEIHAAIRPDVFVSGTTKYKEEELKAIFLDDSMPVFVAEEDKSVVGYVFCKMKKNPEGGNLVPFSSVYIDDLCVDEKARGRGIGEALFRYALDYARKAGCYEVTLNVWEGNDGARRFYQKMGMLPKSTTMELIL